MFIMAARADADGSERTYSEPRDYEINRPDPAQRDHTENPYSCN